jgi:hypothetical protein
MTGQLPRWCWSHQRIECSSPKSTGARCHGKPMSGGSCRAHTRWGPEQKAQALARQAVDRAVRDGRLVVPDTCELCGSRPGPGAWRTANVYAHHEDYARPLDVIWLCGSCHHRVHAVHGGLAAYLAWLRAQLAGAERLADRAKVSV